MSAASADSALEMVDRDVRLFIYRQFVAQGAPPLHTETAQALRLTDDEAAAAYERLATARVIVMRPGTREILMAAPMSAVPTRFRVLLANGHTHWANCVWDALGVAAMLHQDATVEASCGDCNEPLTLVVENGHLARAEGVVHFAVPASRWWDDIVFT